LWLLTFFGFLCFIRLCGFTRFRLVIICGLGSASGRPGRRTIVGRIKSRTFKNNSHRQINLAKSFFIALRAPGKWIIRKFLLPFELNAAVFTPICINWHNKTTSNCLTINQGDYSAHKSGWQGKDVFIDFHYYLAFLLIEIHAILTKQYDLAF
jgi:hypothetical protein